MAIFKCKGCEEEVETPGLPPYECLNCGDRLFKDVTPTERRGHADTRETDH
jgi:DNA-directed RNA polymerase subunit RPC12/RpoP